jgi:hypothetical protein
VAGLERAGLAEAGDSKLRIGHSQQACLRARWGLRFLEWLSSAIVEIFAACGELKECSRDVVIGWALMLVAFLALLRQCLAE